MEELTNFILQFGNLNTQQIELIAKKAMEIELHRDAYFSEAGKVPRQVGFILEGILRVCYYDNKGEEVTKYFIDENHLIVDWHHFESNIAASEYVQAVTDCKMLIFSKQHWEELSDTIVGWDNIVHKIIRKALSEKLDRRSPLVSEDATTRYLTFIEKFPSIANRVPLSYIASYLGITQSSLSRIRKNIR
ncbi:cyclic nucleotide-binding protein [Arachidicoccus ginsenosidimutans]|uniref:Crp/Fnr family transcriptional regulator n=1 Tax=Arachidicoccus sp. BS20 TaxID=1850526 RepID=UPI0007F0A0E9|nr:Crp/Fnr family transcriptional regulator [Arachidicoccus sp. BS20]ANI87879.1 cyclic nucleotide-binding protein [Arachidicoccus sp. BS20]